jgi:hypothetical protein
MIVECLDVFRKVGHALVLFALLAAIGGHWFLLQSVAWTTMLADNLRTSSLPQAVERTFDGRHPCAICKEIAKGKKTEKKSDLSLERTKFEFSYSRAVFIFSPPTHFWQAAAFDAAAALLAHSPPVPPPRQLLG